jgi:hypothetical protein
MMLLEHWRMLPEHAGEFLGHEGEFLGHDICGFASALPVEGN